MSKEILTQNQIELDELYEKGYLKYPIVIEQVTEHWDGEYDPYGTYRLYYKGFPRESIISELSEQEVDVVTAGIYGIFNTLNYVREPNKNMVEG